MTLAQGGSGKYSKVYKEGDIFFFESEPGDTMYIIQSGSVSISKKIQNIHREIAVLGPGDFFGEMSLLLKEVRSATAKAKEETRVLVINSTTFNLMIKDNGPIAIKMIQALAERIKNTDDMLKKCMEERIFIALISFIENSALKGQRTEDGKLILQETMEDLARLIGLPIIKIDEVLKKLEKAGFLDLVQNQIYLKNWKGFMEFKTTYITKYRF